MKNLYIYSIILLLLTSCKKDINPTNILIFTKTEGFRHESIETGVDSIRAIAERIGLEVTTTEDASLFYEKNLKQYACVIFLSTTGDVLNDEEQHEFKRYIQAGGSFLGVHAAADTEYDWPWYGGLVGAYFNGHPNNPNVRNADIELVDKEHISCTHLPTKWNRDDEWYNYKNINPNIEVLLNLDENSYEGGTNGTEHPIAWCHTYDGGRSFYTGSGHTIESFQEEAFIKHLEGGILYCIGDKNGPNYGLPSVVSAENRFEKVVLDQNLNEPMEFALLPNKEILFIERRGAIKLYDPEKRSTKLVHTMDVHSVHEDGLLGLAIDPDYQNNQWIYLFYSPVGDQPIQQVSRFKFAEQVIDLNSEQKIMQIPVQREECCHSAGALEFGPDGNLFISVGDNTNPHESAGFSPSDERPGRSPFDAQKSSGNTNDYRGKILRISMNEDGSYSIPEGNLFAKDPTQGKPEIYVMGCRNPFRFTIDPKTKYLYWGDVGPDAGEDIENRGPRGYDEVNQARKAGFFGWPYFIGNNKPYTKFDFARNVSLEPFDANQPVNTSPNNTGIKELPKAQEAFIWYPYAGSEEFPLVGNGGRNAMAGGVYYSDLYKGENKFPEYYNGKLIIYDWMRGWFLAVTMDENGDYQSMERMMPSQIFNNPMDMMFSPEGELYILEYGTGWFVQNKDARLVKMQYTSGNRKPIVKLGIDKNIGAVPMTIQLNGDESIDHDGDVLTFEWKMDGKTFSKEANPKLTIEESGNYTIELNVKDVKGNSNSTTSQIIAGNEPPKVVFDIKGNNTFYFADKPLQYEVSVTDTEDGSLNNGIKNEDVMVSIDFLKEGFDRNEIAMGHAQGLAAMDHPGKVLIGESDCQSCHKQEGKSVGPSYLDIANKYREDKKATTYLEERIIQGGGGVWGDLAMAAHPQLEPEDVNKMVKYILSIQESKALKSLATKGSFDFNKHAPGNLAGVYVLTSSYKDKGAGQVSSLTSQDVKVLRSAFFSAVEVDSLNDAMTMEIKAGQFPGVEEDFWILIGNDNSSAMYKSIDLTNINSLDVMAICSAEFMGGGIIELRKGSQDGTLIGKVEIVPKNSSLPTVLTYDVSRLNGASDLYLVFKGKKEGVPVAAVTHLHFK